MTNEKDGSTSRSLLANAKLSVPAAWERLVRLYAPLVASWCRRRGLAEQDIGDVLQDVFSAVAININSFRKERPSDTFRGWLRTITRNKISDHFRRRDSEPMAAGGSEANRYFQQLLDPSTPDGSINDDENDEPENALLDNLLTMALASIRNEFQERTWRAFWSVVVEGRLASDVAADLNMSPGAIRVAKSRVLLRLRRELGDIPEI